MEQSEGFQKLVAKITSFEQELSLCEVANKEWEKSGIEIEQEIEEHFAKCMTSLAVRKATLLKGLAEKLAIQNKSYEDTRNKLLSSIEACKQLLKAGSLTYTVSPSSAEIVWQTNVPSVPIFKGNFAANLPLKLFDSIQHHGEITESSTVVSRPLKPEKVETVAGTVSGNVDNKGAHAKFNKPWGVCWNSQDQYIYTTDFQNDSIRKVSLEGVVTTFVKNILGPTGIDLYYKDYSFYVVSNSKHQILKITSNGVMSVLAGSGKPGSIDAVGTGASFHFPMDIVVSQETGTVYVTDCNNHRIRQITPSGVVSTLSGSQQGLADGNRNVAKFNYPWGLCFADDDALLVCDTNNNKLRRVALQNGVVSTLCDIPGPTYLTRGALGNIFLVSSNSHKLFQVNCQGSECKATIFAGNGKQLRVDGKPEGSSFNEPRGLVVLSTHGCFVADCYNHALRKITYE